MPGVAGAPRGVNVAVAGVLSPHALRVTTRTEYDTPFVKPSMRAARDVPASRKNVHTAEPDAHALEQISSRYPRIAGAGLCVGATHTRSTPSLPTVATSPVATAGTPVMCTGKIEARFALESAVTR